MISVVALQGAAAVAAVVADHLVAVHELGPVEDIADMARKGEIAVRICVPLCLPPTDDLALSGVGCNLRPASGLVDACIVDALAGALNSLPVVGILTNPHSGYWNGRGVADQREASYKGHASQTS